MQHKQGLQQYLGRTQYCAAVTSAILRNCPAPLFDPFPSRNYPPPFFDPFPSRIFFPFLHTVLPFPQHRRCKNLRASYAQLTRRPAAALLYWCLTYNALTNRQINIRSSQFGDWFFYRAHSIAPKAG